MKYLNDLFTEFQEKCLKSLIIPSFVISAIIQEFTFAENLSSLMKNLIGQL